MKTIGKRLTFLILIMCVAVSISAQSYQLSGCVQDENNQPVEVANILLKQAKDRYCATVATAAVIAKVTRDRLMVELGAQPQYEPYEWARNKGYGSAAHRDAIAEFGPSDLHRLSWHLV